MELKAFVEHITEWHESKVANLKAVAQATKNGAAINLDGKPVENITERERAFYQLGIASALLELEELPFTLEQTDISAHS